MKTEYPELMDPSQSARRAWLASLLLQRHTTWFGRFASHLTFLRSLGRGQRRRLQRKAAVTLAGAALVLSLGVGILARPVTVHAATITVDNGVLGFANDNQCSLDEALSSAKYDLAPFSGSPGECEDGAGTDYINLPANGLFTISSAAANFNGPTAFDVIDTNIIIDGHDSTIACDLNAGDFRLFAVNATGDLAFFDTTLENCTSDGYDGGAIFNDQGTVTLTRSVVNANEATAASGGGIASYMGTLNLHESTIEHNIADGAGGGISMADGNLYIYNSTISDNTSTDGGGGVRSTESTVYVTGSTVTYNTVNDGNGGGFNFNNDDVTIRLTTISGNEAIDGGGIATYGSATEMGIANSLISGNTAYSNGGGIYKNDGSMGIANSTLSGNMAPVGGGLVALGGIADLANSTVTGNTAVYTSGGIFTVTGTRLYLTRSLISGNSAPFYSEVFVENSIATTFANNYNVFGHNGETFYDAFGIMPTGATDVIATSDGGTPTALNSILETTLQDNGGNTLTHALVNGSPAIDLAPSTDCQDSPTNEIDQREFPRNVDIVGTGSDTTNLCDTGAYELQEPLAVGYCPAGDEHVDYLLTDLIGTGQGSTTKGYRTRKLGIPHYQDVVSLYGQLAAVDTGVMKYVRFRYPNGTYEQIYDPTSPAYRSHAIDWWGSELETGHQYVKGQFFWGTKGNKSPRAFVLWPTIATDELYANVFTVFENSIENHVAWEPGFIASQLYSIDIPETEAGGATVTVRLAIVDNNKDARPVHLEVSIGSDTQTIDDTNPNQKDTLNLYELVFEAVDGGVESVEIELSSPVPDAEYPAGGDSAAIIGAAVSYPCETRNP